MRQAGATRSHPPESHDAAIACCPRPVVAAAPRYWAVQPPSIVRTEPVTMAAAGEAR